MAIINEFRPLAEAILGENPELIKRYHQGEKLILKILVVKLVVKSSHRLQPILAEKLLLDVLNEA